MVVYPGVAFAAGSIDPDAARAATLPCSSTTRAAEIGEQRAEAGQPAGVAPWWPDRLAQCGQQVGVHLVDHQSGVALGERLTASVVSAMP